MLKPWNEEKPRNHYRQEEITTKGSAWTWMGSWPTTYVQNFPLGIWRTVVELGFPGGSESQEFACNARDLGSIPRLGRTPGEGNANSLQYSCLENPMDEGAWYATVHGVAKSRTPLSDFTFTFLIHEVSVNTKWNNVNKVLRSHTIHFNFHECALLTNSNILY